ESIAVFLRLWKTAVTVALMQSPKNAAARQVGSIDLGGRTISKAIRGAAASSANEDEFRLHVTHILAPVLEQWGLNPLPFGNRTVITGGRPDSEYGRVIIEYKAPGTLKKASVQKRALEELTEYMFARAREAGGDLDSCLRRMVGVAIDGVSLFVVTGARG